MIANRNMIVIGGSMGSFQVFKDILMQLPADLPASVFIVQHTIPTASPLLADLLGQASLLSVKPAENRIPYAPGSVYVAQPDFHLIINKTQMLLSKGPRENGTRPAIDPLFRSAAVTAGPRVIGIVLSGMLDDGCAGLSAIKQCGGICVVQDPEDAPYPDMPRNAIRNAPVDHVSPVAKMGALLNRLARSPLPDPSFTPPPDLVLESSIATNLVDTMDINDKLGGPSHLTCPECGGTLWKMKDKAMDRYRCHLGHAYSAVTLTSESNTAIDRALLASLRALEERARLYDRFADDQRRKGFEQIGNSYKEEADRARENAASIRSMLLNR